MPAVYDVECWTVHIMPLLHFHSTLATATVYRHAIELCIMIYETLLKLNFYNSWNGHALGVALCNWSIRKLLMASKVKVCTSESSTTASCIEYESSLNLISRAIAHGSQLSWIAYLHIECKRTIATFLNTNFVWLNLRISIKTLTNIFLRSLLTQLLKVYKEG